MPFAKYLQRLLVLLVLLLLAGVLFTKRSGFLSSNAL